MFTRACLLKYLLFACLLNSVTIHSSAQQDPARPNILILLADDLGWTDLSCYGSTFYETPRLDQLAASGVRFTQNYAASPVCSPTRASLMTGKYPTKTGVTDWIKGRQEQGKAQPYEKLIAAETSYQLALEETTIAEYALSQGYETFFAGKWHLGEEEKYWPQHQGFLANKGGWSKGSPTGKINDSTGGFFTPYQNPMLPDGPKGEYLTDRLTNECLQFIAQKRDKPFLLVHALYAVHNPLQAPSELIQKYTAKKERLSISEEKRFEKNEPWMRFEKEWKTRTVQDNPVYAAMVENMDWNIGRIIDQLKKSGLYENTLILFTSDNGGLSTAEGSPTSNKPLRAGKGWLYEGGIRVPLILNWQDKIQSGIVSSLPVHTTDIFPTIAKAMNKDYQKPGILDGTDLLEVLSNPKRFGNRTLIWHYPHYSNQGGKPGAAIRMGKYKLIYYFEDKRIELYDLVKDIGEQKDLAETLRRKSRILRKKLLHWLEENSKDKFRENKSYRLE